jgi:glycosyltransferase involved in cell wall biosynthesis
MQEKKLNILVVASASFIYGAEKVLLEMIKHLSLSRHNLFCAINGWNDGAFASALDKMGVKYKAIKLGWYYIRKPLWSIDSLIHAPGAYWRFYRLLRSYQPDVVYHYSYRSLFQLYPFLSGNNVYHVHDEISNTSGRIFLRMIDKKVKYYIANSEFIKNDLIKCGIDASRIKLVYNGIDFSTVPVQATGALHGALRIGIIGQVSPRKGHEVMIKALSLLKQEGYNFSLHIFGSGSEDHISLLKDKIEKAGMTAQVKWYGYVQNKGEMFNTIDLLLIPSVLSESFGMGSVESALYCKPVIASAIGGLAEIVIDGETGYLFPPGDEQALAEKIRFFLDDPSLITKMGMAARKNYAQRFPLNKMNEKLQEVLELSAVEER